MNQQPLILYFPDCSIQAQRLARTSKLPCAEINIHHFPDGESKLTLPVEVPGCVIVYRSLNHPNDKLTELLLAARGLRAHSVEQLILVAPYMCYMRQDKTFHPGEIISQQAIGGLLAEHFNAVLTVDAHLHRVHSLKQAIPAQLALNLSATQPIADFLQQLFKNPVLLGPDSESLQWVEAIANAMKSPSDYCVSSKQRLDDDTVAITLPAFDFSNRHVVLVDDVASTGHTLEQAALAVSRHDLASLSVLVTHALFLDNALQLLSAAGIENIWSCDSISHPTNIVALDTVLNDGLSCIFNNLGDRSDNMIE